MFRKYLFYIHIYIFSYIFPPEDILHTCCTARRASVEQKLHFSSVLCCLLNRGEIRFRKEQWQIAEEKNPGTTAQPLSERYRSGAASPTVRNRWDASAFYFFDKVALFILGAENIDHLKTQTN